MGERKVSVLCGTFLISFALLSFEITTVRTINFVVGPTYIYSAIALAMLGLSAAGALFSIVDIKAGSAGRDRVLPWICVGIAVFLVLSQFLVADIKGTIDAALADAGREGGRILVVRTLILQSLPAALKIGTVLLLPYFLFGALLSYLFATTDRGSFGAVYAADLIGAAFGCIGVIFVMESMSYAFSVTFPPLVALLAAAAYGASCGRRFVAGAIAGATLLAVLPSAGWYATNIEPPADPNFLVRDYDHEKDARELWRGWNSFTRVGAVAVDDYAKMSLANGEGMAWLPSHLENRPRPWRHRPTVPALLLDPPKDALVIFAGAGADVISLRENGAERVTGVEMNRLVTDGALRLDRYRLRDALSNENIKLRISEARGFLERDTGRYDLVLLSYSGATAAYYAGMLTGTVQHLFTYEGLTSILDHLKPTGYAVISQVNKLSQLAALRRYLKARNIGSPWNTAVVLFRPGDKYTKAWLGSWDDNPLLIKPSGWTERDLAQLRDGVATEGLKIAYAPGMPTHPDYTVYERILKAADFEKELAAIGAEHGRNFSVTTDNRPFTYDRFANSRYFTWDFWRGPF
ncbi:MAG: class I SAM-dependent methyltransferase, partial [Alphaproteobacteria bacterium]|nr:class I SAM-dependent methyltransferase [Alphaproteobacteria bacterium]